ncbi:MAG: 2-amino-4-hydroxy-6-hydroxymethyldihydropteridine diphosphokinase [candidate division WOR-3 bacterium]|nr:2-amino-4-hydroxy-6-hydroxymethyldihydropteridine diphosphokinase [candidate division WOR-3 bacterium]
MAVAFLGLGSNCFARKKNLLRVIGELNRYNIQVKKCSSIYETPFQGVPEILGIPLGIKLPPVANCVVEVETDYSPYDLLKRILRIEKRIGRIRIHFVKNFPRKVDIDILFYDDMIINHKMLKIPHPQVHKRLFVLVPLAEIAPNFYHPVLNKSIRELLTDLKKNGEKNWPRII